MLATPVNVLPFAGDASARHPKGRPLDIDELRAFVAAIHVEQLHRFVLLILGTACRPNTALDLKGNQLDRKAHIIHLNPIGRRQNKKHRPTVKMPSFIYQHFVSLPENHYAVSASPNRIGSVKRSLATAYRRAGVTVTGDARGPVTAYSLRHTAGAWLRAQQVPEWEAQAQMGHKGSYGKTTEIYAPARPDYLSSACAALEQLYQEAFKRKFT